MSEVTLESQIFEIIKDKDMPERIKLAKLEMLVMLGVDMKAKDECGFSALGCAAREGCKEVAEFLIEKGADVNIKNIKNFNVTPLIYASRNGHKEVVELLIKNGALVDTKDKHGWTALMQASRNGHKEVAELLIDNKANVNVEVGANFTPLILATKGSGFSRVQDVAWFGIKLYSQPFS